MPRKRNQVVGRRTPKNQRDPAQAEKDREVIALMYLQGHTQTAIGEKLGLSQQMVSYDLGVIRKRWIANQLMAFDERIALQLAKIDAAEAEYWQAWEATKGEDVAVTEEKGLGVNGPIDKTVTKKRNLYGSAAYMAGVLNCIEQRSRLLCLDINAAMAAVIRAGYEVTSPITGKAIEIGTPQIDLTEDADLAPE